MDIEKATERSIAIAKLIDPFAWRYGHSHGQEVTLRIARKIIDAYPELARADALIAPDPLPAQHVHIPVQAIMTETVQPTRASSSMFAKLANPWRNAASK